jgi:D-tagatose-bisphosphate aldolase class II non-catalytic subunit
MMVATLDQLAVLRREGRPGGITSVCSAHPLVLRAALRHGRETGATVLIEATCNQVNHQGGYTGMAPTDFADLVRKIAKEEACPPERIFLGGDHLGPNPWRDRPAEEAMAEAEVMVAAYVAAGFRKIHLDASMGCQGEAVALDDQATAARAVRLAAVAEKTARDAGGEMPVYVIGTEVPPPGGADHTLDAVEPTSPQAARRTIEVHRETFRGANLEEAFLRVIALVVQPGIEFGNRNVIRYDRQKARDLVRVLEDEPRLVFEAHSTDYQGQEPLGELVEDGFGILKVGPELTFALREALYALDLIATDLLPDYGDRPLFAALEQLMLASPGYWNRHYDGNEAEKRLLRHYSLSDRIRYYWAMPEARAAVDRLIEALLGRRVPMPLFRQHLPGAEHFADTPLDPAEVLIWRVGQSMKTYHGACFPGT